MSLFFQGLHTHQTYHPSIEHVWDALDWGVWQRVPGAANTQELHTAWSFAPLVCLPFLRVLFILSLSLSLPSLSPSLFLLDMSQLANLERDSLVWINRLTECSLMMHLSPTVLGHKENVLEDWRLKALKYRPVYLFQSMEARGHWHAMLRPDQCPQTWNPTSTDPHIHGPPGRGGVEERRGG